MSAKVAPTLRGAGITPACPKCGHNKHVIRVWFGGVKQWACSDHYKIMSTKSKPMSIKDRVLHRTPEADTMSIADVFPNRAARRAK